MSKSSLSSVWLRGSNRDSLGELLSVALHHMKVSKKQLSVNISDLVLELQSFSGWQMRNLRHGADLFSSSNAIFSYTVKGLCILFAKQVEAFLRDGEQVLAPKPLLPFPIPARVSMGSAKRRSSSVSSTRPRSRRSSIVSVIQPIEDFDCIMDLDALCADLSRRSSLSSLAAVPTASPAKKKSRSGSSVSEDCDAFDAVPAAPSSDDFAIPLSPLALPVDVVTPPRTPARRLKGFDPKSTFTNVEWVSILRGDKITRIEHLSVAELISAGRVIDVSIFRSCLSGETVQKRSMRATDSVSVAEAVDLDSVLDELRAEDDFVDHFDEIVAPRANRPSVASSFAASIRRQSIASDVFDLPRMPRLSLGRAEDLKSIIREELAARNAKRNTVIDFSDLAEITSTTRKEAASVFIQLVVLASRNELRFNTVCSGFHRPSFILTSDSISSSDSSE